MTELKSIWHKLPSQPEEDRLIVVKSKRTGEYLVGNEFEFILDNFTKWAYFDDLLALETELERTRKALDVAVDALKLMYQGNGDPQDIMRYIDNRWTPVRRLCKQTLEQITALEQIKNIKGE